MDLHGIRRLARETRGPAAARIGAGASAHAILMATLADLDFVHRVTPEGSVLGPGVAGRLYRNGRVIRVADRLGQHDRTFVAAHELGHYLLHPHESLDFRAAPAQPGAPAAPHGTYAAIGYSERERIEAEADAFAAEFLCPSDQLRDEIVRLGRKPSAIAGALGISTAVVTAQAIHAVLLPPPAPAAQPPLPAGVPDRDQEAAAAWAGRALLVEGKAGTGKTATAAARIAWLAVERDAAGTILALSPTAATAADLRQRLGAGGIAAAQPWIGTPAELGFEIIAKNAAALGFTDRFRLLDETGALTLFERCLPQGLGIRPVEALRAVLRAKERLVAAPEWIAAADEQAAKTRGKAAKAAAATAQAVGHAYAAFERALAEADAVDAASLAALPVAFLRSDGDALAAARRRFRHAVVDGLQDLGPAAIGLIELLAGPETTVWAAGDAAQCAVRFRGASPATLVRFAQRFEAGRIELTRNHRSTPEVVRFAASLTGRRKAAAKALAAVEGLFDGIEDCRARGIPYARQAILGRTHGALKKAVEGLDHLGIPVAVTPDLIKQGAVSDLLALAQIASEGSADAFARLGRLPEYGVPDRDLAKAADWARTRAGVLPAGLTRKGASALRRLAADLDGLDATTPASMVMTTWLFERSGYLRRLHQGGDRRALGAIHHLIRIAQEHEAQGDRDHGRLVARVKRAGSLAQDTAFGRATADDGKDAVRAMTVHAARGLEFDAVHLVGMANPAKPREGETAIAPAALGLDGDDTAIRESEAAVLVIAGSRARRRIRSV